MSIFICSTRHWSVFGMPFVEFEILYDGVRYRCDEDTLDRLYDGTPIDECDLILVDQGDDDD
jgi:hypothetical protein